MPSSPRDIRKSVNLTHPYFLRLITKQKRISTSDGYW